MPTPKTTSRNERAEQSLRSIRSLARLMVYDPSMAGIADRYAWVAKAIFDLASDALTAEGAHVG